VDGSPSRGVPLHTTSRARWRPFRAIPGTRPPHRAAPGCQLRPSFRAIPRARLRYARRQALGLRHRHCRLRHAVRAITRSHTQPMRRRTLGPRSWHRRAPPAILAVALPAILGGRLRAILGSLQRRLARRSGRSLRAIPGVHRLLCLRQVRFVRLLRGLVCRHCHRAYLVGHLGAIPRGRRRLPALPFRRNLRAILGGRFRACP